MSGKLKPCGLDLFRAVKKNLFDLDGNNVSNF